MSPTPNDDAANNPSREIKIDLENSESISLIEDKSEPAVIEIIVNEKNKLDGGVNAAGSLPNGKSKPSNIPEAVQRARDAFNRGVTKPAEWRRTQLKNLLRMYEENRSAMIDALHQDLRRSKMEAILLEIDYMVNDLRNTLHYLDDWIKPTKPEKGVVNMLDEVVIYNDPYGVALVIGAWNYPLQLLLLPMAGAIAAGNAVIVKPSELSAACAKFVAETLPKYLDNDAILVVEGGAEETTELLKQKFDYIFYTGGTNVGKLIYSAATKNLTPVTLELGGKSPVYIDNTVDINVTAKRILWGKFINAGQTCIAPDYILCTKEIQDKFVEAARKVLKEWYGEEVQKSPDFCRIVNSRHFSRVQAIVDADKAKIAIGGSYDPKDLYIEPTILTNVVATDKCMQDEIFGPVLPIMPVANAYEAIKYINERETPLVLYVFTSDKPIQKLINEQTRSGTIAYNDTVMFYAVDTLPFGGVGNSGMGAYHGKASFDTFTHKKSCLVKNFMPLGEKLASSRYPPYTEGKLNFITSLMRKRHGPSLKFLPYLLAFALGAGVSYGVVAWNRMASQDM